MASGILKLGGGAVGPATPGLQAAGAPTAAPTSTLIPTYTPEPPTLTPSPTPPPRPTQTPVPTVILQPTTARPTATPTKAGPTKTPQPAATYTPTAANEPRAVTVLSPMPGTRFRTSQITFKWTGGALQGGETFLVLLAAVLHLFAHLAWWDRPYAAAILANGSAAGWRCMP